MADGFLYVRTSVYREALPIWRAKVYIKESSLFEGSEERRILGEALRNAENEVSPFSFDISTETGEDGRTKVFAIGAPPAENSLSSDSVSADYSLVDVYVEAENFIPVRIRGVQIFAGITGELPVNLLPFLESFPEGTVEELTIPQNALSGKEDRFGISKGTPIVNDVLTEVFIPQSITVHLGVPEDETAENLSVSFTDYIKNVASSEIYPTWNENTIRANVLAQISLCLNRVYTEWYPSRGYDFQITNTTLYDQAFVKGRNIFENISRIVDELFSTYIRRIGNTEPLFARYCDGIRSTCSGMSQWGSQFLGEQGYEVLEILRYYYGENIELVTTDDIRPNNGSYPGTPLSVGSFGEAVSVIQRQLVRIRNDYPLLPPIIPVNGVYASDTAAAVKEFQSIFGLPVTGIVDRATWYEISRIYTAVKKLGEVTSEGEKEITSDSVVPGVVLGQGDSGSYVRLLQSILDYIALFYPSIPGLVIDGYFGAVTDESVRAFQRNFGLLEDGVVGKNTWAKLYEVYEELTEIVTFAGNEQLYPGSLLSEGSEGEAVRVIRRYLNTLSQFYPGIPGIAEGDVFDAELREAVIAFQLAFDLSPDGVVGPLTWTRLVEVINFLENAAGRGLISSADSVTAFSENGTESSEEEKQSADIPYEAYPGVVLRHGANGEKVSLVQRALNRLGYDNGVPLCESGFFDGSTGDAVKSFRTAHSLGDVGEVDADTWERLFAELKKAEEKNRDKI